MAKTYDKNAYLQGQAEHTDRYGQQAKTIKNWQIATASMTGANILLVLSMCYLAVQSRFVPFVVEVDKLGQAVAVSPADKAAKVDQRVVAAQIADFITNARSVVGDNTFEKRNIDKVYAVIPRSSASAGFLNDYYKAHDPFKAAETQSVSVDILTVLPVSGKTWQVEWRETSRNLQGQIIKAERYKGAVEVQFNPPTTAEGIMANPTGLYITSIAWTQEL